MIQLMLSDLMKAKHNYTRATVRACCLVQGSQHVLNSPILFEETEEMPATRLGLMFVSIFTERKNVNAILFLITNKKWRKPCIRKKIKWPRS